MAGVPQIMLASEPHGAQVLEAACAPGAAASSQLAALRALRSALQAPSAPHGDGDLAPAAPEPARAMAGGGTAREAWALACFARAAPHAAATARCLLLGGNSSNGMETRRDTDVQVRWRDADVQVREGMIIIAAEGIPWACGARVGVVSWM